MAGGDPDILGAGTSATGAAPGGPPSHDPSAVVPSIPSDAYGRVMWVFSRAPMYMPDALAEQFKAFFTPTTVAVIAGFIAVWAASHYAGVGFVADGIFLVAGVVAMGLTAFQAVGLLRDLVGTIADARSEADLDKASRILAELAILVGVEALLAILTKGAGKRVRGAGGVDDVAEGANAARAIVSDDVARLYAKALARDMMPEVQRARMREALGFFENNGMSVLADSGDVNQKVVSLLKGIDLSSEVKVTKLKPGDIVTQWSGGPVGEWFSFSGQSPEALGIARGGRELRRFRVKQEVEVLQSRAAGIADTWTPQRTLDVYSPTPGGKNIAAAGELAGGGGKQMVIPRSLQGALSELPLPPGAIEARKAKRAMLAQQQAAAAKRQAYAKELEGLGGHKPGPIGGNAGKYKIHEGKQGKHDPAHKNYKKDKSVLLHKDPQAIVDARSGTGRKIYNTGPNGVEFVQKEIVECGEVVGLVPGPNGQSLLTTRARIDYSPLTNEVHVVPARPAPPPKPPPPAKPASSPKPE